MTNTDFLVIETTNLESTTGGRAWETNLPQAAVGQVSGVGGATAGTQPRGPLGRIGDVLKTIYRPAPIVPQLLK